MNFNYKSLERPTFLNIKCSLISLHMHKRAFTVFSISSVRSIIKYNLHTTRFKVMHNIGFRLQISFRITASDVREKNYDMYIYIYNIYVYRDSLAC